MTSTRDAASEPTLPADGTARDSGPAPSADDPTVASADDLAASSVAIRPGGGADFRSLRPIDPKNFAIEREIARGGMGRIIAARDLRLGRPVAIKELLSNTRSHRARFEREARITARLQHPGIVNIHEAGTWPNGEPFYVMRLIGGRSLDKVIANRETLADRMGLLPTLIAAVDALAYAHNESVIHRDLKPANVLAGEYGETVVIDWGLAKDLTRTEDTSSSSDALDEARQDGETVVGAVLGTPAYMPPEQALGEAVDARADVYALGAMFYHLLAGRPPFAGRTTDAILAALLDGPPAPLASLAPTAPRDLVAIVEKAMARTASDRYPTARELASDLRQFQTGQLVGAHRYTAWQLVTRWARRHRIALAVAVAALAILVVTVTVSFLRVVREQQATQQQGELAQSARSDAEELLTFMLTDLRAKLDPLGKVALLDDVASRAVAYYANRPEVLSDADEARRAKARRNLGDVLRIRGDTERAHHEYIASRAALERLVARQPASTERRFELAISQYKIGLTLVARGDSDGALTAFREHQRLLDGLLAMQASNVEWLRSSSLGQMNLGRIASSRGDVARALAAFQEARGRTQRLVDAEPANTDYQRDLAAAHVAIGEQLQLQGDTTGALEAFRASRALAAKLAAKDVENAAWQGDLAVSQQKIGAALVELGDSRGALAELRASAVIYEALAVRDPDDAYAQADVSGVQVQIGEVALSIGDVPAALTAFRATLVISERLSARDPTDATRRWIVAFAHEKVGDGLRALGDAKAALAEYRASLAIAEEVAAKDPGHADKQRSVASAHQSIGDQLLALGELAAAVVEYERALEIAERLAASDPSHVDKQRALAAAHGAIGKVRLVQERAAEATAQFRLALDIGERLAVGDPANTSIAALVAQSHGRLGRGLAAEGKTHEASIEARAFLSKATALATTDPSNVEWQLLLAEAHQDVGDIYLASGRRREALASFETALAITSTLGARAPKELASLVTKVAAVRRER